MAVIDGVKMIHNCQAVRIMDGSVKCVKINKTVEQDGSEVFTEDFASSFEVAADSVIIAIGQGPGSDVVSVGTAKVTQRGLLEADEFGRTSQQGVFAAGDVVTGPRTVIEAVAFAKKAAEKIEEYINQTVPATTV
jgi:glutamate synthase (NADPH/NADH) small chain